MLGYRESRTTRHGLLWKKKKKKREKEKENESTLCLSSKNVTSYPWSSAASVRSRLWPIAISKGLYLRIFLHPSALKNHLALSDLQQKSCSKPPSEFCNLSGKVLLLSWRPQPISEICQQYFSSNLTSKPSCSPRLSRRSSTPDCRLCICICVCSFVFKCGEMYVEGRIGERD